LGKKQMVKSIFLLPEKPHPARMFLALNPAPFPQSPSLDRVEMKSASLLFQLIPGHSAQPTALPHQVRRMVGH
jgi:hypothetical protein